MLLEIPATYLATLPVTAHVPSPVGSQMTPRRGLNAPSFVTSVPDSSTPWFLSQRTPRFAVTRLLTRHASLKNSECVRKFDPRLAMGIGLYWISVVSSLPMNFGITPPPTMNELVP